MKLTGAEIAKLASSSDFTPQQTLMLVRVILGWRWDLESAPWMQKPHREDQRRFCDAASSDVDDVIKKLEAIVLKLEPGKTIHDQYGRLMDTEVANRLER